MSKRKGETREEYLARQREYRRDPEVRAREAEYRREYQREYRRDPEVRARAAERRRDPEVRAKKAECNRARAVGDRQTYLTLQVDAGWPFGCALCGVEDDPAPHRGLAIDHDHATGALRGVLCSACNTTLGVRERNGLTIRPGVPRWGEIADLYLAKPPLASLAFRAECAQRRAAAWGEDGPSAWRNLPFGGN